jgi:serine phosphatase RsbU (regulator of sigma subunit)/FixJ family two-component response regulator/anti-sigma regulatory factor (Ser/Thr protein kinase)
MAATLNPVGATGEQPLAIPEPALTRPVAAREPASILLVDDDERSLRALTRVLEPLGQNLVTARSGEEALRWLLREEFAVILLDMRMPGLDGLQTARYINVRARTRHIPIIFLTAQEGDVERVFGAHAAGAVDYVAKPFEPGVLRSKVGVFVELHHARAEHVHEARARAEAEGIASTIGRLQSISDAALAHLELSELLPEILKRATAVFPADVSGILMRTDDDHSLTLLRPDGAERVLDEEQLAAAEELLAPALGDRPTNLAAMSAPPSLTPLFGGVEIGSLVAAPLSAGRATLGVLFLASGQPARFSEEDMVVLGLGAERAAIALEHARSYERERDLVEVLQDHLLPEQLPRIPGLEMAARYRPSERVAQVGGDWYDAILLPDGRLGLVIGDVVGHGIAAAALMAELRAALRAYAMAETRSPARVVSLLNALFCATHRKMVATLVYMIVDAEGTAVRFASAGHPPPLLAGADGERRFLQQRASAPLGVAAHTAYRDFEGELRDGDTLLLYTDGLVERRGEAIDAGLERLAGSLASAPPELERLCAHVLQRADPGSGLEDDTAMVAVRRLARDSDVLELKLPAEPHSVPTARHRLQGWLKAAGALPEDVGDIILAANEACTNAVEHAYGPSSGATFRLLAERSPEAIVVRVSDSGRWRAPRGTERGRGLRVIACVMDELDVRRTASGTIVEMSKEWSTNAGS